MKLNTTQLYEKISSFTFTGKVSVDTLNRIIYDNFKKRRIGLLDNHQLEKLLEILEKNHG